MGANEQWGRGQARRFRGEHGLGTAPIKDVFEMVHLASGVDAFSIEAAEDEHGLTMFDPDTDRHVIVVATTPHPMRQRSSVAHELSHVIRGDLRAEVSWTPGDRSPAEVCADAFARHLLLPSGRCPTATRDGRPGDAGRSVGPGSGVPGLSRTGGHPAPRRAVDHRRGLHRVEPAVVPATRRCASAGQASTTTWPPPHAGPGHRRGSWSAP